MNDLMAEKIDIHNSFYEATGEIEVELDAEEMWLPEEDEKLVDEAVKKVKKDYKQGILATSYYEIRVLAAIAFCDAAEIEAYDYAGAGGEKYEDD